jgi:hypothetical protein
MWIFTPTGFYSVVEDRNDDYKVFIRARRSEDIKALEQYVDAEFLGEMLVMPKADYPFRVHVDKETAGDIAYNAAMSVSYENFKSEVAKHDKNRAGIYHDVWDVMLKLETDELKDRYNPYKWHYGDDWTGYSDDQFDNDYEWAEQSFDWPEENPNVAYS